jgi:hypothetical protein
LNFVIRFAHRSLACIEKWKFMTNFKPHDRQTMAKLNPIVSAPNAMSKFLKAGESVFLSIYRQTLVSLKLFLQLTHFHRRDERKVFRLKLKLKAFEGEFGIVNFAEAP